MKKKKEKFDIEGALTYDEQLGRYTLSPAEFTKVDQGKQKGKKYLRKFERAKRVAQPRHSELEENMAFYEGKWHLLERYKTSRPFSVRMRTPYATTAIDIRVASLIAQNYKGQLLPLVEDTADAVKALQELVADEWDRLKLDRQISKAIKQASIVREGYLHFVWNTDVEKGMFKDKRKGFLEVEMIDNPSQVYIDPDANSLSEAMYVCIPRTISAELFGQMYPEWEYLIKPQEGSIQSNEAGNNFATNRDNNAGSADIEQITLTTIYEKYDGYIKRILLAEDVLIEENDLEGNRHIPVAQFRWRNESHSPYGLALMDDIVDLQKAINQIETSIVQVAVGYAMPSYAIKKGVGISGKQLALVIGAPGLVLEVDGNPREFFAPLQMPTLDQNIVNTKQEYINAIDRIAGITNPFLGSIGTAGNTAQGARITMERARIIEQDVMANIEDFVSQITDIMVDFLSSQYSGMKLTTRVVDTSNGIVEFVDKDLPESIKDVKYSFYVQLDSQTTYSKEREKELLVELYQMQHQYDDSLQVIDQKDIIKAYNLTNKAELMSKFDIMQANVQDVKAQMILDLTQRVSTLAPDGSLQELLQTSIVEILMDAKEQPSYEQLMETLQQLDQEAEMKMQEGVGTFVEDMLAQGVPQEDIEQALAEIEGQESGAPMPEQAPAPMPEMPIQ